MMAATQDMASDVKARILAVLEGVPDPEIPVVSIIELGIVRSVEASASGSCVTLTPTYSGCPATQVIERSTREALDEGGFADTEIRIALAPAWSTSMITADGHRKLREYGIAPPVEGGGPAECPRCGSHQTHEVSRFGSTPCKALWQCGNCAEPFDRFKCH